MCKTATQKKKKTKIIMPNGSLMQVESIALGAFCNTFDLHSAIIGLRNQSSVFWVAVFTQVLEDFILPTQQLIII